MITRNELLALAADAAPQTTFPASPHERDGGDDWGSERQIAAENKFFDAVRSIISVDEFEKLEAYCLKATTEEMITEGLRLALYKLDESNDTT